MYTDDDRKSAAEIEVEAKKVDAERTRQQKDFIASTFEKQLQELPESVHDLARAAHATAAGKRTPEQNQLLRKHPNLNVTSGSLYLYDRKAADELKKLAAKATGIRATQTQTGVHSSDHRKTGTPAGNSPAFPGQPGPAASGTAARWIECGIAEQQVAADSR